MMFEKRLIPTAELIGKAQEARRFEDTLPDLFARQNQQAIVMSRVSAELEELLATRRWESVSSPEDARAAKREIADLSERVSEERELFRAISMAIQNAQSASASATNVLNKKIEGISGSRQGAEGQE